MEKYVATIEWTNIRLFSITYSLVDNDIILIIKNYVHIITPEFILIDVETKLYACLLQILHIINFSFLNIFMVSIIYTYIFFFKSCYL